MSDSKEIEVRLIEVVSDELGFDREEIVMGSRFAKDLLADDLDLQELFRAVEDEFEINFESEDLVGIKNVSQLLHRVQTKVA